MRDIEKLSVAGVPVFMRQGKGGGIGILDSYILDRTLLSDDEKKEILSSLNALEQTSFGSQKETLEKLKGIFGKSDANTDWIEIAFSKWGKPGKLEAYFDKIKNSILNSKVIQIKYVSNGKAASIRRIKPLKLFFKGYSWYVYGYCFLRKDYRYFKLSRILELQVTGESFKPEKIGRLLREPFEKPSRTMTVQVKVAKDYVYRAADEMPIKKTFKDGSALCEFTTAGDKEIVSYILSYGSHIQIRKPLLLKEMVQKEIEKMSRIYF